MVFLLISLPAVPVFHLPPHNQIAWAVTAQIQPPHPLHSTSTLHSPTIPISSFTLALTLSFYRAFALNRDSPESPGDSLQLLGKGAGGGGGSASLIFPFNEDAVIRLRGLIRRLINTSHLIISLQGAEVLRSNGLPRPRHNTHTHISISAMECSDQRRTIFES